MKNDFSVNSSPNILFSKYNLYREKSLSPERITHDEVIKLTEEIKNKNLFKVDKLGESIEGRDINLITAGTGGIKILAWTQMHGDEPTATAAIFDVLNFLSADDELNDFRRLLLSKIKLFVIPMLNPDGAELHQRENILNVDLNRDAAGEKMPEAKILLDAAKNINPKFGFNLHDQNSYYTAGRTNKTAAISLLAPPFNYDKQINEARKNSMKVTVFIYDLLSEFIPGNIARYNDDYEPRAFGDNFTNMGISSILIESGFLKDDDNKNEIRKLNFTALISAFQNIADENYKQVDHQKYFEIPENESLLFDLLLRNLTINHDTRKFKIDIGIKREKCFDSVSNEFYFDGKIDQIGDLSNYFGIDEINMDGMEAALPKISESKFNFDEIEKTDINLLHTEGILYLKMNYESNRGSFIKLPINLINTLKNIDPQIKADEPANLIIRQNEKIKYLIINGFLKDLTAKNNPVQNGLIID
jgi:hypothetical protein